MYKRDYQARIETTIYNVQSQKCLTAGHSIVNHPPKKALTQTHIWLSYEKALISSNWLDTANYWQSHPSLGRRPREHPDTHTSWS